MEESIDVKAEKSLQKTPRNIALEQSRAIENGDLSPLFADKLYLDGVYEGDEPVDTIVGEMKKQGKIPYSRFMELSLFGPDGYYSGGHVKIGNFKEEGHFQTSPEQSEVFGATVGRALGKIWESMGKPETFQVVEMGAGQGALAHTLLHWVKKFQPEFYESIRYKILEYGTDLIPRQQERNEENGEKISWVKGSAFSLPFAGVEGAFISNELPDAFPVEKVTLIDGKLKQRFVSMDDEWKVWVETWEDPTDEVQDYIARYGIEVKDRVEEPVNLFAEQLQKELDKALKRGAILTIDYGADGEVGDKNLATRAYGEWGSGDDRAYFHSYLYPGRYDLTADVNFSVLRKIAVEDGLDIAFNSTQDEFLVAVGAMDILDEIIKEKGESPIIGGNGEVGETEKRYGSMEVEMGNFRALLLTKEIEVPKFGKSFRLEQKDKK